VAEAGAAEGGRLRVEPRPEEIGIEQARLGEESPAQIGLVEGGPLQAGVGEVRSPQVGAGKVGLPSVDLGELRAPQIGPGEVLAAVVAALAQCPRLRGSA
jgi:hypothetical protein